MSKFTAKIYNFFKAMAYGFMDTFQPCMCVHCDKFVKKEVIFCDNCRKRLYRTADKVCIKCGQPKDKCQCGNYVYHFEGITAPFVNDGPAKSGIYKFKFSGESRVVPFYASEMVEYVRKYFSDIKFDYICPVPTTIIKIGNRGYNQTELLAKQISEILDIKLEIKAIRRRLLSRTQHRTKNVQTRFTNAYKSYKPGTHKVSGNVLLVDDIVTSRATADSCALCLLKNGADKVYVVSATMSQKNNLN